MRSALKLLFGFSAVGLAALVPWLVSCAASEAEAPPPDPGTTLPSDSHDAGGSFDATTDAEASAPPVDCSRASWCPVQTPVSTLYALTAVWGSSKSDVWAVGSGGTIVHYDGTTWTLTETPVRNTFHAVWGSGPNDVWAVSMTDTMFHTTGFANGKAVWTRAVPAQAEPDDQYPRATLAIWGMTGAPLRIGARDRTVLDPRTGTFATINQYTLRSAAGDAGAGWAAVEGAGAVHGFWGSAPDDLWYVADNSERNGWQKGVTVHGTAADGGAMQWTSVDSQSNVVLEGIWGSASGDLWAVGEMGVLRHFVAGAARWAIVPSPTTESLHAVWGSAANDVWAVGDGGTIVHYDGTTWSRSTVALPGSQKHSLYGVWGSSANDVWIVGDGVTLHYTGARP